MPVNAPVSSGEQESASIASTSASWSRMPSLTRGPARTYCGIQRRCSLLEHLRGLIRSRTWKDATGARQRPHVSIDWDEDLITEVDDAHRHGTQGNVSPIVLARVAATVVQDLQRLAAGDAAVTAILAAWEEGLVDRDEVIERTALTDKEYKAARARLTYLVLSLPQSLRESARTVLRGKS